MMNRERKLSRWVTLVLALLLVGSGSTAQAQWAVQNQVLASSGGTWSVGGWTLDFTLGEPVIETWALGAPGSAGAGSGGWGSVTQGFHQPQRVRVPVVSPVGVPDLPVGVAEVYPNPFSSDIHLSRNGRRVNAKSIMGVMMLAAGFGSEVLLEADGPDEEQAMQALRELVDGRFGEGQ